ncbi:5,6-dimethylbenzimidazole synthase [Arcobacter sp. FWKO B]|uniref:5,6-dimethylbenzimidazole synthase n=1 Tax=Arcobacter sp. FWKO B TaxID=2593672 RepID=UPI001906BF6A|nr:5,6-dimethylbenzimidazole synthase [Arcobacter sp. FWKO B]
MIKFTKKDQQILKQIISARRDIRGHHFNKKEISKEILDELLTSANNAPSVGFSQPWEFVIIKDEDKKEQIYKEFEKQNTKAKKIFESNELYKSLKLEGIKESYVNIAVLYKKPKSDVLGQTVQKKMGEYSVVCAIQNLWLSARSHNIGVGWVSILRAKKVKKILGISKEYKLISYLCVGYVDTFLDTPELETLGWEKKKSVKEVVRWV